MASDQLTAEWDRAASPRVWAELDARGQEAHSLRTQLTTKTAEANKWRRLYTEAEAALAELLDVAIEEADTYGDSAAMSAAIEKAKKVMGR